MNWRVEMTDESEAELRLRLKSEEIDADDIAVLKKWITEVETQGIESAQLNRTWRDHELEGKWKGHRAISFSYKGRVIYRLENEIVVVRVVRVTTQHDYS